MLQKFVILSKYDHQDRHVKDYIKEDISNNVRVLNIKKKRYDFVKELCKEITKAPIQDVHSCYDKENKTIEELKSDTVLRVEEKLGILNEIFTKLVTYNVKEEYSSIMELLLISTMENGLDSTLIEINDEGKTILLELENVSVIKV